MEFRLLGPVEVVSDGRPLHLGGRRQRAVLTHLALSPGTPVSAAHLVDRVWADGAPAHVRASLHSYVSRLRNTLGPARLETRSAGYVLHATVDEVDVLRFEQLLSRAVAVLAHDPRSASDGCGEALALWRGPALGDLADEPALHDVALRLEALREHAVERRAEARLACGEAAAVVPDLAALVERSPLREDLWERYVLALYRSGRPAEAVAACDRARHLLADELGVAPSPAMRRLYEQVLRQDPDLALHRAELHGYRLGGVLGRGPSAVVHRALQPWLGRTVALKVLHPAVAGDPRVVQGFAAAAQAAAAVEHPHVLELYDCWREPGEAVLALRLAPGGSLQERLDRRPLEPGRLLRLVDQLASGLEACAEQGVVHRALTPQDVLLDGRDEPQLSAFLLTRDLTREPDGTPADDGGDPSARGDGRRDDVRALAQLVRQLSPEPLPRLDAVLSAALRGGGPASPQDLAEAVARALRPVRVPAPRAPVTGPPAVPPPADPAGGSRGRRWTPWRREAR